MATDKQLEANRQNAQLCTGPKTAEGKLRSSQNALKTGIHSKSELLVTESREALDELIADFHTRFAPATPEERSLVDALIRYEWLSRRYMAADTAVWNYCLRDDTNQDGGVAFLRYSGELSRAGRYFNTARKGFTATLKELQSLQEKRKSEQIPVAPSLESEPNPILSRDREGAVAQHSGSEPKPNQQPMPKLVSFRQLPPDPQQEQPQATQSEEKQPPNEPRVSDDPDGRPKAA